MKFIYIFSFYIIGFCRRIAHILTDLSCKKDITFNRGVSFTSSAKVENISKEKGNIVIEKDTLIEGRLVVFGNGGYIKIGRDSYIGSGTNIWSGESIIIGDNVLISHNVNIMDTNSHEINHLERIENYKKDRTYGYSKEKRNVLTSKIKIEDYVWVSFGVTILKGVTIGKGAIIAAGSIVTKDVPPFTLVAGNPARLVKELK